MKRDSDGLITPVLFLGIILSVEEGTLEESAKKWTFSTPNLRPIRSSPAIGPDGTVYFATYATEYQSSSHASKVFALNPDNGELKWSFAAPIGPWEAGGGFRAAPTVDAEGTVYIVTWDVTGGFNYPASYPANKVYALDSETGWVKWERTLAQEWLNTAAIGPEGDAYVAAESGGLLRLNANAREKLGISGMGGWSPPVLNQNTIYLTYDNFAVGGGGWGVVALTFDGEVRWDQPNKQGSIVLGANGIVYLSDGAAFNSSTGEKLWEFPRPRKGVVLGPDNRLYIAATGSVHAVDALTGAAIWDVPTADACVTPAVGDNETLYIASCNKGS